VTPRAWRALLAAGAAVVILHVAEQLFTAPAFVDALSGFTLELAGGRAVRFSALVYAALGWAGLVGVGAFAWAASERWPRAGGAAAAWVAVLLVASGVFAGAPFGAYFVARAVRGGRVGRRAMAAVVTLGVLLSPVALLLLYVTALATLYALSAVGALG
jgi:hypothetical protein